MLIVDGNRCSGCRICEKNCPTGAIRVTAGKAEINNDICNSCLQCIYVCPNSAIIQEAGAVDKIRLTGSEKLRELSRKIDKLQDEINRVEEDLKKLAVKKVAGR
jgi:ferredoxin